MHYRPTWLLDEKNLNWFLEIRPKPKPKINIVESIGYTEHWRLFVLVSSFFTFWFLVTRARLSWPQSAFQSTQNSLTTSYRIGLLQGLLSLYLLGAACAQWKTRGGKFSSFVKGDLNEATFSESEAIRHWALALLLLLLLFPINQLVPTQPHESVFMRRPTLMYAQTKKSPILVFFTPQTLLLPQLFPGSILLPSVIGVDAPPPVYSAVEGMFETNEKLPNK